jgi:hypothetical protein
MPLIQGDIFLATLTEGNVYIISLLLILTFAPSPLFSVWLCVCVWVCVRTRVHAGVRVRASAWMWT